MNDRQRNLVEIVEGVDYKLVTPQEAMDYIDLNGWNGDTLAINRDGYKQSAIISNCIDLNLLDDKIGGDWIYLSCYDEYKRYVLGLPS